MRRETASSASRPTAALVSTAPPRKSTAKKETKSHPHSESSPSSSIEQLPTGALRLWKRAIALTRCIIRSNAPVLGLDGRIILALCQDPALVVKRKAKQCARITSVKAAEAEYDVK